MGTDNQIKALPDSLILFDGVCNLCNASVNFIIDRDKDKVFSFASLQSEVGALLLKSQGQSESEFESVMLWKKGVFYTKSRAALEIGRQLSGLWPLLYLCIIFPAFLRDFVYDYIAARRYKWFGKSDQCRLPAPELAGRFVENMPQ